ncbi:MAG: ComEC/Rec2 family competence protein [Candidatus Paceibacterota bacterium]|jgi:competence protein ComEC
MLVIFFISFLGGAIIAPFLNLDLGLIIFVGVLGLVIVLYTRFLMFDKNKRRGGYTTALILFALSLSLFRVNQSLVPKDDFLRQYVDSKVALCGIVIDEPNRKDGETTVTLAVTSCGGETGRVSQKILVHAGLFLPLSYGDLVQTEGTLLLPKRSADFDYKMWLAKNGIFYELRFASTTAISHGKGNIILSALYRLKQASISTLGRVLSEPHSSLLAGLLVGAKTSLGETWLDIFRRVGIVHIIVLSGYNITIVAKAVLALLRRTPRRVRLGSAVGSIILFALFAGGGATIWRAGVMALIALFATESYRKFHAGRALLLAGFLMVIFQPLLPAYDASFQLSFLATLGLVYITPIFEPYFIRVTERFGLREIITATFATQIAVLPIILTMSGTLSLIGPLTNILILPIVPITMAFGFITLICGSISWVIALPFTFISYGLLSYMLGVSKFFSKISFSSVQIPISITVAIIFYMVLGFFVIKFHRRQKEIDEFSSTKFVANQNVTGKEQLSKPINDKQSNLLRAEEFEIN